LNKGKRDPNAPWNPRHPVEITPAEFERQIFAWVRSSPNVGDATVTHQATVKGQGGEYAVDIHVHITVLGGANLILILECKHQGRAVERDDVIILEGKVRDTGSHKGILFSTSGFQQGAISYAAAHGIATVTVVGGDFLYETRAMSPSEPPPWASLPRYAGLRLSATEKGIATHSILPDHLDAIMEFLAEDAPHGA
jgi:restriction system protein